MVEFSNKYKITKLEDAGQPEIYKGITQKRLFPDTYISKNLPLLKYYNSVSGKINAFIKEISVDCISGQKIAMDGSVEPYCSNFNGECVGHVTQNDGQNYPISDIAKDFLIFCKPEAIISKEGIVLFYYDMNIAATIDGKEWYFLSFDTEWAEDITKKQIERIDNIVTDFGKTTITFIMEDGTKEIFELCFELDFLGEGDIIQCFLSKENV